MIIYKENKKIKLPFGDGYDGVYSANGKVRSHGERITVTQTVSGNIEEIEPFVGKIITMDWLMGHTAIVLLGSNKVSILKFTRDRTGVFWLEELFSGSGGKALFDTLHNQAVMVDYDAKKVVQYARTL